MMMVIVIDNAKISQFLVVSEELVMVMMTMMPRFVGFLPLVMVMMVMVIVMMMPRFVGFLPIKSTNLVVPEEMVQYNKICCFIGYILVIAYNCGNIL